MGFPEWTLWGMGLSAAGALIAITFSWLGQSPQMLRRLGLSGARLDLRVRAFTGYALALLLLAFAFFLAGVPLGSPSESETVVVVQTDQAGTDSAATQLFNGDELGAAGGESLVTPATPATGAFSGPPSTDPPSSSNNPTRAPDESPVTRLAPSIEDTGTLTATLSTASIEPSSTPTSRPTETATTVPTNTPFPTITPTTIAGETALVSTSGSTLWLKRSPGGQNLVLVRDGDLLLIRSGRANQGGILWREVATGTGIEGWLQDEFLLVSELEAGG